MRSVQTSRVVEPGGPAPWPCTESGEARQPPGTRRSSSSAMRPSSCAFASRPLQQPLSLRVPCALRRGSARDAKARGPQEHRGTRPRGHSGPRHGGVEGSRKGRVRVERHRMRCARSNGRVEGRELGLCIVEMGALERDQRRRLPQACLALRQLGSQRFALHRMRTACAGRNRTPAPMWVPLPPGRNLVRPYPPRSAGGASRQQQRVPRAPAPRCLPNGLCASDARGAAGFRERPSRSRSRQRHAPRQAAAPIALRRRASPEAACSIRCSVWLRRIDDVGCSTRHAAWQHVVRTARPRVGPAETHQAKETIA